MMESETDIQLADLLLARLCTAYNELLNTSTIVYRPDAFSKHDRARLSYPVKHVVSWNMLLVLVELHSDSEFSSPVHVNISQLNL